MLKTTNIFRITIRSQCVHGHKIFLGVQKTTYLLLINVHGHTAEFRRLKKSWPVPLAALPKA